MTLNHPIMRNEQDETSAIAQAMASALSSLEAELGLHLTVHDHHGLLSSATGLPLLPGRNYHGHPYCRWNRQDAAVTRRCVDHCVAQCDAMAMTVKRPFETHCWKGIREVVVPIFRGDDLLLTLYAGGFRDAADTCPLPGRQARAHFVTLTLRREDRIARLKPLLHTLGMGLLQQAEQAAWAARDVVAQAAGDDARAPKLPRLRREAMIQQFMRAHAHRADLRLADLSAELHLSPSRCGHLVRELTGRSFQALVLRERLKRSRTLLTATDWPLPRIAEAVGIPNASHFNRLFHRHVGQSPGAFRRKLRQAGRPDRPSATTV